MISKFRILIIVISKKLDVKYQVPESDDRNSERFWSVLLKQIFTHIFILKQCLI